MPNTTFKPCPAPHGFDLDLENRKFIYGSRNAIALCQEWLRIRKFISEGIYKLFTLAAKSFQIQDDYRIARQQHGHR